MNDTHTRPFPLLRRLPAAAIILLGLALVAAQPVAAQHIVWSQFTQDNAAGDQLLRTASRDGDDPTDLLITTLPLGIALHDSAGLIYWVSRDTWNANPGAILRAPLTGGAPTVIVPNLARPRHIAIDPLAGHIYWTDAAPGAERIERADLDGAERTVLLTPAHLTAAGIDPGYLYDPVGIALDLARDRLYWVNHKGSSGSIPGILSARLDGSSALKTLISALSFSLEASSMVHGCPLCLYRAFLCPQCVPFCFISSALLSALSPSLEALLQG